MNRHRRSGERALIDGTRRGHRFEAMHKFWQSYLALAGGFGLLLAGCGGRDANPAKDTTSLAPSPPAAPTDGTPAVSLWNMEAGRYFAVASTAPEQGQFVDPFYSVQQDLDTLRVDTARAGGLEFDLFSGGDPPQPARVVRIGPDSTSNCTLWPVVHLAPGSSATPLPVWRVAFPRGRVESLAFDSLSVLSAPDSARITIEIARAASRIEGDTASAFRGRPYVVRQANRFSLSDGNEVVLTEVARLVNQEANPLNEQLLLILERATGSALFRPTYHVRTIGLEEDLESMELLAVLRVVRTGGFALLLRREGEDGSALTLMERRRDGVWKQSWRSAYAGC